MVSVLAIQKTKEVGIRKVLGASIKDIVFIFSKEFTILISIPFFIAAPVAYYFMYKWLAGFYYHISPGWSVFAITILLSILIAWITVGYQSIRGCPCKPRKEFEGRLIFFPDYFTGLLLRDAVSVIKFSGILFQLYLVLIFSFPSLKTN